MVLSDNLIFLHGWGTNSSIWQYQVEYFSKRYTVRTPDINQFATSIFQLPAILIGWSYGGMLAIEMVCRHPDKLKALTLIGCSSKFTDGLAPTIVKNLRRNLSRNFKETMRKCYGLFFSEEEIAIAARFIKTQPMPDEKNTLDILGKLMELDLKAALRNINIPTLIIHGDKDQICPISQGEVLHKGINGSRLEIIKSAGHMPFYTRQQEVNAILADFLEDIKSDAK